MQEKLTFSRVQLILLILGAYAFSFLIRMYWVMYFQDNTSFYWNDEFMINTNDGYFFASMAQKILEDMHIDNPRVLDGWRYGVVVTTVLLAKITPFSLETIIFYLPAVISSLVVVPVILIGQLYGRVSLGFFAALIGSIAWSYYNRTMVGYYDTDMFSAMAPMFILYFLLATIETEKPIHALLSALSILVYPFLYDSGLSIVYAMGLSYMFYMVVFHRNEHFTYYSIMMIAVALMGLPWYIKAVMIGAIFVGFKSDRFSLKQMMVASGVAVLAFLITGNVFTLILAKLMVYAVRGSEQEGLMFYQVAQTVREAGQIPFSTMANRISGSTPGVLVALIGYGLMVYRHKSFILALPLLGIGVFSLVGGLRFTVYAVPVAAIAAVFTFAMIADFIAQSVTTKKLSQWVSLGVSAVLTTLFLLPNVYHIVEYKVPTVFDVKEVKSLNKLKSLGSDKDYVITWWDYGYPIWFYANKNTLIDGGKHNHDNYLVSKVLTTTSQKEAAYLSRLAVETYVNSEYETVADTLFKNGKPDQINVENFFEELSAGLVQMPQSSRDVYFYLPYRMLGILPTVKVFSNIDLSTGKKITQPFFYQPQGLQQNGEKIVFDAGVYFDQNTGKLHLGSQSVPVGQIVTTGRKPNGEIAIKYQTVHPMESMFIVILQEYNKVLLMDAEMFYSTYIQMFFLENYDPELFEPVEMTGYVKIYKLKI